MKKTVEIEFNEELKRWELDLGEHEMVIKSKNDIHILTSGYTNIKSKRHFMNMFPHISYEDAGDKMFIDACNAYLNEQYTFNPDNYSFESKPNMSVEPHNCQNKKDS